MLLHRTLPPIIVVAEPLCGGGGVSFLFVVYRAPVEVDGEEPGVVQDVGHHGRHLGEDPGYDNHGHGG